MLVTREAAPASTADIDRVVEILGGQTIFGTPITTRLDAHKVIEHGFPEAVLTRLVANVELMQNEGLLQKALGISKRTFYRRKKEANEPKSLSIEQSGRTWKFAELLAKATQVFGDQKAAERWMEAPAIGLDRERPIDLLSTPAGIELVETYLEQIDHGVYI